MNRLGATDEIRKLHAAREKVISEGEFKKLSFKDQVQVVGHYLEDISVLRTLDKEFASFEKTLLELRKEKALRFPEVQSESPITFIEGMWAAYSCYFKTKWFEHDFSPLEALGIKHKRFFGFHLFTFPLIQMDRISSDIFEWLSEQPYKTRQGSDIFYYLVKMRAAAEFFIEDLKEASMVDVWNASVIHLNDYKSVSEINGLYPVYDESDLTDMIDDLTYIPLQYSHSKRHQRRSFLPLVPAKLYSKEQFHIRSWDFLVSRKS